MKTRANLTEGDAMKKSLYLFLLLVAACAPAQLATSLPPTQIMNQFPTPMPTPTLAVITKPISEQQQADALNFFYELKNRMALGEYEHFAEEVRYPITVKVDGEPKTLIFAAEMEANFDRIFSREAIQRFISTDETELIFTPDGFKMPDGSVWFNLICMDPVCEDAEFLITEINN